MLLLIIALVLEDSVTVSHGIVAVVLALPL